jgi:two-component system sensor histidine kinase QseC
MRNLLDNAAKYSEQEQVVEIEVTNAPENNVLITIKNNNNIITESDRLGERFYRHSQHQHIAGAGLGLSIVMMIIDLHQGQITFTQQKEQFEVKIILPIN